MSSWLSPDHLLGSIDEAVGRQFDDVPGGGIIEPPVDDPSSPGEAVAGGLWQALRGEQTEENISGTVPIVGSSGAGLLGGLRGALVGSGGLLGQQYSGDLDEIVLGPNDSSDPTGVIGRTVGAGGSSATRGAIVAVLLAIGGVLAVGQLLEIQWVVGDGGA